MPNTAPNDSLLLWSTQDGVTTLTMNNPRRLNGWTMEMMDALKAGLKRAASDDATQALILTGSDPYYCAGVNLGASLKLAHPARLHQMIRVHNQALFDAFLNFPKPILAAVNGPAIGAAVTSATLCDAIIASEKATFNTPFGKLGVPPEGCSSVVFEKLVGVQAQRILGDEGWQPTGQEALDIGLVEFLSPHEQLMSRAHAIARTWIEEGRTRSYPAGMQKDELKRINATESIAVATAFLSPPFLIGQFQFLWSKGKRGPALMFLMLRMTQPIWGLMI
ncbi:MAG: peroxisomal 3,2-trans-enoyl-CoA isomerase [Cognaticolwellia sp.]|jgi:peroxisomal 3,2-trans-enoyl-CoA isomerase